MTATAFWTAIGRDARSTLTGMGRRIVYADRAPIFEQGSVGDTMLVIETGRVEVFSLTESGARLVLGHLGPCQIVGEIALLDQGPRSASVVATGPVTGVLIHFDDVRGFLLESPEVMFGVVVDLAAKLRAANALTEGRGNESASVRLARCLVRLATEWGSPRDDGLVDLSVTYSQRQLGELAGLTRETVNRHLRLWADNGWLVREGGRVTLLRTEALARIAAGEDATR